ncbi:MAG: trigger factor [Bacilli bacterium]
MENKTTKDISIKVTGQPWKDALDKAFTKANEKVKLDGFRKGKAPKDVFIKKYGDTALLADAADLCLQDAYGQMLEQIKDDQIVAQPEISLNKIDENEVDFKFTLTLRPEVKLGKYKNLKIKKDVVKITKEEIKEALDHTLSHYAENIIKEGTVANGDTVIMDFEGFKEGEPFEGGKGENYSLTIGSGTFIPGFEEQLIGLKQNDEKEINITFPEEYHSDDLKGKPVLFKVKIHEVKELKVPEMNQEFFDDLGLEGVNSKETLEQQVIENLKVQKENNNSNEYIDKLLEEAAKDVVVTIPDVMIEEELKRMLKQYEENIKMQGITLEQFYQFSNSDEQALKDQMKPEATNRIKYRLMLEEIAKEEDITIDDKTALLEADKLALKYKMTKEEFLDKFGGLEMIKYDYQMRQAIEILKGE